MIRWMILSILVLGAAAMAGPQQAFPHPMNQSSVHVVYLGKAHMNPADKRAIVDLVFKRINPQDCSAEIDNIRIARAALHSAQETELLVQASDNCNCGGTGNCAFWILHKTAHGFDVLLETDMVQIFSVEATRNRGYKDVMTSAHGSATFSELTLYEFDGKRYHKARCADQQYPEREDGGIADKPVITLTPCGIR
jgi:hypothetical protein